MPELAHTGSTRYIDVHGVRRAVYVRTIHKAGCRHTQREWGCLALTKGRAAEILAQGVDHYDVNHNHNPAWSVWRLGGCCKPTLEDLKEIAQPTG